jgi:NitT/TauT family transport system permease protein
VAVLLILLMLIWYGSGLGHERARPPSSVCWSPQATRGPGKDLLLTTWNMERPVLPAPHQVALDFWSGLVDWPLDSPRNLLFHVAVTGPDHAGGFCMGTLLGLVLAVLIVHSARWTAPCCPGSWPRKPCRCWPLRPSCW